MESFNMTYNVITELCRSEIDVLCMLLYVFLTSLTLITVFGNLLVIISIAYFKQLHTPTNYLILSLAVADLLIGAVIFPLHILLSLSLCYSNTTVTCLIRGSIDFTISASSILNLCCIAVDRYYAVCHPLLYKTKITENAVLMMSLGSWAISVLTGVFFFFMSLPGDACEETCLLLLLFISGLIFYLPTIMLVFIYCKIFIVAKRQARSIQNTTSQFGAAVSQMEKKSTKTLAVVVGLYMLCWVPLFVSYPFQTLSHIVTTLMEPFNWFALSNSMFNPFIYAFFYRWFRSAIRMIISGKIFQGDFANTKLN